MKFKDFVFLSVALIFVALSLYFDTEKISSLASVYISQDHQISESNIIRIDYLRWTFFYFGIIIFAYYILKTPKSANKYSKKILLLFKFKYLFYILFVLFLMTRLWLLLTSQSQLDDDEAVIGLMAKHITEGKSFPFFFYGEYYNGGAAFSAYITSLLFLVFGISPILVKIVPLIYSIIFFWLMFFFSRKYFGLQIANLTSLFIVFSPPFFFIWNLKNRGGYMELLLFSLIALWYYYDIYYGRKKKISFILLGLILAFLIWISQSALILVLYLFLFTLIYNRNILNIRQYLTILISFLIGLSPLLIFNLKNCFLNFSNLFRFKLAYKLFDWVSNLIGNLNCAYPVPKEGGVTFISLKYLFFDFVRRLFSESKLSLTLTLIFLISLVILVYSNRKKIISFEPQQSSKYVLVIFFPLFCILFFGFYSSWELRHLFLFYLTFFLILALFVDFFKRLKLTYYSLAFLFILLFILSGLLDGYSEYQKKGNTDYMSIIDYINKTSSAFYSPDLMKNAIIFYSNENLIGSCDYMAGCCMYRYPKYEQFVNKSNIYVFVVPKYSNLQIIIKNRFLQDNINFNEKEFDSNLLQIHDQMDPYNVSTKLVVYSFTSGISYRPYDLINVSEDCDHALPVKNS